MAVQKMPAQRWRATFPVFPKGYPVVLTHGDDHVAYFLRSNIIPIPRNGATWPGGTPEEWGKCGTCRDPLEFGDVVFRYEPTLAMDAAARRPGGTRQTDYDEVRRIVQADPYASTPGRVERTLRQFEPNCLFEQGRPDFRFQFETAPLINIKQSGGAEMQRTLSAMTKKIEEIFNAKIQDKILRGETSRGVDLAEGIDESRISEFVKEGESLAKGWVFERREIPVFVPPNAFGVPARGIAEAAWRGDEEYTFADDTPPEPAPNTKPGKRRIRFDE